MPFRPISLAPFVALACLAAPAASHEFWIEPEKYQVESGAPLRADLRNGQKFRGVALAYFATKTARFELIRQGGATPVEGRMGDIPALDAAAGAPGLLVIVHETEPETLVYATWDKFRDFVRHKDAAWVEAAHAARGLPPEGFTETYRRFAKALVAVGDGRGQDAATGMETEFVALGNPYTDPPGDGLTVALLYRGAARGDAQVEVFDKAPDGEVTIALLRTDAQGRVRVPLRPGHRYLLDAVVLRPAPEGGEPVWESLWAALSFAVPG